MELNTLPSRDDVIVEMFTEIRGMIFNFARKFNLEFDDCLQHASLFMLEVWPTIPDGANVKAYLCGAVKNDLYSFLRQRGQETLSLDVPIAVGSTETFADMLQAFVQKRDEEREDFIIEVTHAALRKCRLEEQKHAKEFYGLNSFNPLVSNWRDRPDYNRSKEVMRKSVKCNLSKNPQVLALMQ